MASKSLWAQSWARLSGRAFSAFAPVEGGTKPFGLLKTYDRVGLDGVVETLWRSAKPGQEFFYGWIADQLVVCLRSPALVHQAFSEHAGQTHRLFPAFSGPFSGIHRIFGDTLLTCQHEKVRQTRQIVLHRFYLKQALETHFAHMLATVDEHVEKLASCSQGRTPDVGQSMVAFTMDTWCRTQLGVALPRAAALRLSRAISACEVLATSSRHLIWRGILDRLGVRQLSSPDAQEAALRDALRLALDEEIIAPHRVHLETRPNLLKILVDHERDSGREGTFHADAVFAQMSVLLLTGHESAASLLTWALYELARNPDVERRVRAEMAACPGLQAPTFAQINAMPYLTQLLQEVLRLHPSAPYLGRSVTEDFSLQTRHGPIVVPRKAVLATSLTAQHLNPEIWGDDAAEFKPERFTSLSEHDRTIQFMPFSVGPRRCPGYPFALLEAKLFLVRFLQRCDFSIVDADKVEAAYLGVLKTKAPMQMQVRAVKPTCYNPAAL